MIFLNATSAQVGERVSLRCMPPDSRASKFVFCKNGHLIASRKALSQDIAYTLILLISEQSAGRYSCGYQKIDGNSRKNSALSADSNLIILPGKAMEMFPRTGHLKLCREAYSVHKAREATSILHCDGVEFLGCLNGQLKNCMFHN